MVIINERDKQTIRKLLQDPETPAVVLLTFLIDNYGTEALDWDPSVIASQIIEDFDVDPPQIIFDKLNAIITALTTDRFYRDWEVFNNIAQILNEEPVEPSAVDLSTPEEIAWALTEVALLENPKDRPEFDPEVRRFMGVAFKYYGLLRPPDVLRIADIPKDQDLPENVFSEDPIMFNGWENKQQSDASHIVSYVTERLNKLVTTLDQLPMQNRDSETWTRFKTKATKAIGSSLKSLL